MITLADYWMGRDATYTDQLTDEIRDNAVDLLGKINLLLSWAKNDGIRAEYVASGWRPPAINEATAHAAASSRHLTGDAVDLRDNGVRDLARWCLRNLDALDEIGLWMEDPQWTPTWVHLQRVPPKSRNRVFIPSSAPALCALLPEQEQA